MVVLRRLCILNGINAATRLPSGARSNSVASSFAIHGHGFSATNESDADERDDLVRTMFVARFQIH